MKKDWSWQLWPALPLYPYGTRRTVCTEVVKDTIWTFDQLHGILYAVVPIRMTVVRLDGGGMLVYAPVAPTAECIRLINELVGRYGEVKYIILPTSSGLEHKVFVGPFARCFPRAMVFVAPHQWSFPINLPLSWLGFPAERTQVLPILNGDVPFADEFEYQVLDINLGRGSFVEVAMLHKRSRTLLLTDTILSISAEPLKISELDPYPLLFHARDNALEIKENNRENRRKGWQRISLFAVYFRPHAIRTITWGEMFRDALQSPTRSRQAYFGLFPFRWQDNWQQSFDVLRGNGRPFVAPILQVLIFPQAPTEVISWANEVATWDFTQIIPCHFDAPILTNASEFRRAFSFLERQPGAEILSEEDMGFIRQLEAGLVRAGIAQPAQEKV